MKQCYFKGGHQPPFLFVYYEWHFFRHEMTEAYTHTTILRTKTTNWQSNQSFSIRSDIKITGAWLIASSRLVGLPNKKTSERLLKISQILGNPAVFRRYRVLSQRWYEKILRIASLIAVLKFCISEYIRKFNSFRTVRENRDTIREQQIHKYNFIRFV